MKNLLELHNFNCYNSTLVHLDESKRILLKSNNKYGLYRPLIRADLSDSCIARCFQHCNGGKGMHLIPVSVLWTSYGYIKLNVAN
jgi:hypothetical protein